MYVPEHCRPSLVLWNKLIYIYSELLGHKCPDTPSNFKFNTEDNLVNKWGIIQNCVWIVNFYMEICSGVIFAYYKQQLTSQYGFEKFKLKVFFFKLRQPFWELSWPFTVPGFHIFLLCQRMTWDVKSKILYPLTIIDTLFV